MKKVKNILIILLMLFISINIISAKTVDDVACVYSIKNPSGNEMTTAQVQIIDYNDGAGGRIVVFYKDQSGQYVNYSDTGPTYNWQNSEKTDSYSNAMLRFFTSSNSQKTFISNYKTSGKCPVIYSNVSPDGSTIDIDNNVKNLENQSASSKALSSSSELLRNGDGAWESRENFFKDDTGQTTVKDDLVCSYDMNFDMYNITTPVEFRTIYNPTNGSKSYRVSVNGSGQTYSDLNTDIALNLGQGGSGMVKISSSQLKSIFKDGSCYDRSKLYHYYDQASGTYIITTSQSEASENGTNGRYDNGDGSNDGAGGTISNPNLDIGQNTMSCSELLGTGLTALIGTFIKAVKIAAVFIAVVMGMMNFLPVISGKAPEGELKKAFQKSIKLLIVLVIVVSFSDILDVIGKLFGFDLSCIS